MSEKEKNSKLEDLEIDLLLEAVNRYYGYDFHDYEPGLVKRRILEGMLAGRVSTISRFQEKVLHQPAVMERFLRSFSSSGNHLFSGVEFYRTFRTKVVPNLRTYPFIRIWHVGCSTGEDVYSMAILLHEEGLYQRSRIYATDLSEDVIRQARIGSFDPTLAGQSSADYREAGGSWSLGKYFKEKRNRLVIDSALKKNIVFSQHNPATDGSFNEFQVIVCRDVLSSFNHTLRERVNSLIYESLSRLGVLALGPTESLDSLMYQDHYVLLDEESRLYQKQRSVAVSGLTAAKGRKGSMLRGKRYAE